MPLRHAAFRMLVAACMAFAVPHGGAAGEPALQPGEATLWYLGHCAYAVKTAHHLLVFDYSKRMYRGGAPAHPSFSHGWIDPEALKGEDVVVFVTHDHSDHHDPVIRSWERVIPRITYVYGWKVPTGPRVHALAGPRSELLLGGLKVSTVNDHHDDRDEVAFLVQVDGLTIYHNGDYSAQAVPGGPFRHVEDTAFLKSRAASVDLFFAFPSVMEPYPQLLRQLAPKAVFPMHLSNREAKYLVYREQLRALGIDTPVQCPMCPGHRFEFRDGRVVEEVRPPKLAEESRNPRGS